MEKKEAMKILKEFHDKSALFSVRTALDTVIPELVESEDERIRKGIIQYLEQSQFGEEPYQIDDDVVRNYIAWLEKQKPSDEALQYLKENHSSSDVSDFQTAMNIAVAKAFDAGKKAQKPVEWSEEDEKIRKAIFKSLSKKDARDVLLANGIQVSDALAWLEKQGEKKESPCDKCKREQPSYSCQDITELGRCALEKQDERKYADKK